MKRVMRVRKVISEGALTNGKTDSFAAKLAEITNQIDRIKKAPSTEAARTLVADGYRHVLDMTPSQVAAMARELSPTGMLILIEGLAAECRRLNQLAVDAEDMVNGPHANHDPTAGEANDVESLSKQLGLPGGAASVVDVQLIAQEIAQVLGIVIEEHERRQREASVDDGILQPDHRGRVDPFARSANNAMTLDQLEAWGRSQAAHRQRLARETDVAGALGLSKAKHIHDAEIAKSGHLPSDSYGHDTRPLAQRIRRP